MTDDLAGLLDYWRSLPAQSNERKAVDIIEALQAKAAAALEAKDKELAAERKQSQCYLDNWRATEKAYNELDKRLAAERERENRNERDKNELWHALKDLSYECDCVTSVGAPTRATYNRTFAVLQKHQATIDSAARKERT